MSYDTISYYTNIFSFSLTMVPHNLCINLAVHDTCYGTCTWRGLPATSNLTTIHFKYFSNDYINASRVQRTHTECYNSVVIIVPPCFQTHWSLLVIIIYITSSVFQVTGIKGISGSIIIYFERFPKYAYICQMHAKWMN